MKLEHYRAGFAKELGERPHDEVTLLLWADVEEERGDPEIGRRLRVHAALGKNYVGLEAYLRHLGVRDVGEVPPLPAALTPEFLEQPCPITRDDRTIGQTHRLPDYRTALGVELVTALVLDNLQNGPAVPGRMNRRLFNNFYGFCADTVTEGCRVCAGQFLA